MDTRDSDIKHAYKITMDAAKKFESDTPLHIETNAGPVIMQPVKMYNNSDGSIIPTWKIYPVSTKKSYPPKPGDVSGKKSRRNKKRKSAKRKSAKRKSAKRKSKKRKTKRKRKRKRKSKRL